MKKERNNNFIDNAFSIIADIIVRLVGQKNKAGQLSFQFYRNGLSAQSQGKYSKAFKNYYQALQLEFDEYDRSYILYNIGLLFSDIGEDNRALIYYFQALEMNPTLFQALNNIGVIFYDLGEGMMRAGQPEEADLLFLRAEEYWRLSINIAPYNYPDVERWLKIRANK